MTGPDGGGSEPAGHFGVSAKNCSLRDAAQVFDDLHGQVASLERDVARWEEEAVMRAATVGNDLTLRAYDAERAYARLLEALRRIVSEDQLDAAALRRWLQDLVSEAE